MKIEFREAKSIITKSTIPSIDFVINPYTGCQHGCIYCYAEFMKRFTNHKGEQWGKFLDIKQYDWKKIKPEKYNGKTILFSSVTDPYTPAEHKYRNTRQILSKLIGTTAKISMLTKSSLIKRDFDLLTQFENVEVGISINTLDEYTARDLEPLASHPRNRLEAIRAAKKQGLSTYVFISPFLPYITNFKAIIQQSREYTDYYRFENFNFRPHNVKPILTYIERNYPQYLEFYKTLKKSPEMWDPIEDEIHSYCKEHNIDYKQSFHHGGFAKKDKRIIKKQTLNF